MNAVLFRLRAEARRSRRSLLVLAVLLGISAGTVFTAWTGARRSDGAYPTFLRQSHAAEVDVGVERLNGDEEPFLRAVEKLPQVIAHARRAYVFIAPRKPNGEAEAQSSLLGQPIAAVDDRMWRSVDGERIVAGRHADPKNPEEITVGRELARKYHVRVGQVIPIATWSPAAALQLLTAKDFVPNDGPNLVLRVVGVEVSPGELAAASFDNTPVHLTPAFFATYRGMVGSSQGTRLRLRHGTADVAALRHEIDALASGDRLNVTDQAGITEKVERSIHLQATSLRLFAALVGLAALVMVGHALARHSVISADEQTLLRSIGMTRAQLAGLTVLRSGLVAVGATAIAVALSVAASVFTPVGLARVVDIHPGVRVDVSVVVLGALSLVLAILLISSWAAWASTRPAYLRRADAYGHPSRMAAALARGGLPPAIVTGSRFALEPGAGRASVPVRSTVAGATLAVAALTCAVCFGASLTHLTNTPRLFGWNWQLAIGNPYAFNIEDSVVPGLLEDASIGAVAAVATAAVTVNGRSLTALGTEHVRGVLEPTLVSGDVPDRPDQVTLGPKTLRALHRHIGDTVTIASTGGVHRVRVVGAGAYPSVGVDDPGGVGEGVGMTLKGLHVVAPDAPVNIFPFTVRPGVDVDATVTRLRHAGYAVGQIDVLKPTRPTDIENYLQVRWVPALLAAVLGFLALGTLANTLLSSVRLRRRDIALLKTLGFVRGQIRAAVAWQATILAALALVVGLPLGTALGTWAWKVYATQQGFVPEPSAPVLVLAFVVPALLAVSNVIALGPAGAAARTAPATTLRED